jgi:hypothetical protein
MAERKSKAKPSWSDIKSRLSDFDRAGLIGLIQGLYTASKETQVFLHARFSLGSDVLEPYKKMIARWLWPDVLKNQDISVLKPLFFASRMLTSKSPNGTSASRPPIPSSTDTPL